MKRIIVLAALLGPGIVGAQSLTNMQPTMNEPNYSTVQPNPFFYGSIGDTPTTRRQKATRALALREEAARLLSADGGTFTREHEAYIRRKAQAILTGGR